MSVSVTEENANEKPSLLSQYDEADLLDLRVHKFNRILLIFIEIRDRTKNSFAASCGCSCGRPTCVVHEDIEDEVKKLKHVSKQARQSTTQNKNLYWVGILVLLTACLSPSAAECLSDSATTMCSSVDPSQVSFAGNPVIIFLNLTTTNLGPNYFSNITPIRSASSLFIESSHLEHIHANAFNDLPKLNHLELTNCEIRDVEEDTFLYLDSLEQLNLGNNELKQLHLKLKYVQELILSYNKISLDPSSKLQGDHLGFIDLSNNAIQTLDFSFSGTSNLLEVDLSYNFIEAVSDNVFTNNQALERVNISHNQLNNTKGLMSSSVQSLDLSFNKFSTLNSEMFQNMVQLQTLQLSHNFISNLNNAFLYLLELQLLDLSNNQITSLSPEIFANNYQLETLHLSNNNIQVLTDVSAPLVSLFYLDFSHNEINKIEPQFFKNISKLSTLDLSFNSLQDVTEVLSPLTALAVLDVSNNKLTLGRDTVFHNNRLVKLNLSSNNFSEFNVKYLKKLTTLDIRKNQVSSLCGDWFAFQNLVNLYISGNQIKDINCLRERDDFPKLGILELFDNPLTCDDALNDTIENFMMNHIQPYSGSWYDTQGEWNKVKKGLCPDGADIFVYQSDQIPQITSVEEMDSYNDTIDHLDHSKEIKDDPEDSQETTDDSEESKETTDHPEDSKVENLDELGDVLQDVDDVLAASTFKPELFTSDVDDDDLTLPSLDQSQKHSWEQAPLDSTGADADDGEDDDNYLEETFDEELRRNFFHFPWFTVAVVLLAIALILTLVNIAVWLYFRRRGQSDTYITLKNEVYRDTTAPTDNPTGNSGIYSPLRVNRIFKADKINEILLNFGLWRTTEADSESVKQMIVESSSEMC